jgi:hypothetical protein
LSRARKRPAVTAAAAPRSELDLWVEDALARELGKKLGRDHAEILGVLRGDPEVDTVSAIEDAVRAIKVTYARAAEADEFDVCAEIAFEDGGTTTGRRRFSRESLPESVKDELARKGGAFVFRAWHFPWHGPDRGWS